MAEDILVHTGDCPSGYFRTQLEFKIFVYLLLGRKKILVEITLYDSFIYFYILMKIFFSYIFDQVLKVLTFKSVLPQEEKPRLKCSYTPRRCDL